MRPCRSCGHPVTARIGFTLHCGNPACKRYDERLEGVDAGSPAIKDGADRERLGRALTPPGWVRWVSGLMFLIPTTATLYARFVEGWPAGWWTSLLPTLPFGGVGVLVLFSGSAGRRIAEETKAQEKLRADRNLGCGFGLIMGIFAFAGCAVIVVPIIKWMRPDFFGLPPMAVPFAALALAGVVGTLWGLRRAPRVRRNSDAGE